MKTSVDIFKNLNESFEEEYSKQLKESKKLNEEAKFVVSLWGEDDETIEYRYFQDYDEAVEFLDNSEYRGCIENVTDDTSDDGNYLYIKESEKAKIEDKIEKLEDEIKNTKIEDLKSDKAEEIQKLEDKLDDETLTEGEDIKKIIFNKYRDEFDSIDDVWDLADTVNTLYQEGGMDAVNDWFLPAADEEYRRLVKALIVKDKIEEKEECKEEKLEEEETIEITQTEPELDYVITDVTEIENCGDGDVQAPDIDAMLTFINESLKEAYGENSIKINIHSSNLLENGSFALVDITTPQILKEFESKHIYDAAIGKNLVLENDGEYYTFKVNSLNGTTRYSKRTLKPMDALREWIETEFLSEAKKEKEAELAALKAKTEKETVESYVNDRPELKQEKANIEMFIQLAKSLKNDDEMKGSIQNRMYALAAEMPANIEIEVKDKDKYSLDFTNRDEIVEILFGKQWVKDTTEIPGNEIPEVVDLNEAYDQFNIGNIEVVYNPQTQECLYSIESADVHDKKINLTKIPSVETPYDTETIIKDYIEKQYGPVPVEEEEPAEEEITVDVTNQDLAPVPAEEETEVVEEDVEAPAEGIEGTEEETTESEAETGSAYFVKIRPGRQKAGVEDIRQQQKDGVVQQKSSYIKVGEVNLSQADFDALVADLTQPHDFLENVKPLDRKNYAFNVVEVMGENSPYTLLIDPTGFNYARYVAIKDAV